MLEIALLGLLMKGPKHGYEMKKILEEEVSQFLDLSSGPVYYTLKGLEGKGLVSKTVGQAGRRPEKYIYEITEQGKEEFRRLLGENFLILQRPFLNIDLSLYFLEFLDCSEVREKLDRRLRSLREVRQWAYHLGKVLRQEGSPPHRQAIAKHTLIAVQVEIDFVRKLLQSLESETG